jgi:ABC-type antimicrobial peptide transport system permease subunit
MFRHNLLLIYRNFKRFKSVFFINLIGLSTGLACALLIYLWVSDELKVDHFNEKDDQLYQVMQNVSHSDGIETIEATSGLLAKALADEMPEVEYTTAVIPSFWNSSKGVISRNDTRIKVKGQYASKDFFNVFSYKLIQGDRNDILSNKEGIVISTALAKKLFNTQESLVGKPVEWSGLSSSGSYFISGVFESPPSNATDQFDFLLSYELFSETHPWINEWENSDPRTFVLLKKGASAEHFNDKLKGYIKSKHKNSEASLFVQRYSDRYLHGRYENGISAGGRIEYVRLFSIIATFILAIACVNFMNLSTAKASRRIKEVGIKKAIGAGRLALIFQYMCESMLMSFLSLLVGILMVDLLLSQFNVLTGKHLFLNFDSTLILAVVGVTLFTGLVSGSYPSLYLSGFNPTIVLKGKLQTAMGEVWARKGLVIFQFSISVILIVSVLVVYQQMQFVQSKELGYDRDHVIYFDTEKVSEAFLSELKRIPGVINAGRFYHDLTGGHGGTGDVYWEGKSPDDKIDFGNLEVGYDLIETLGMKMVAGRSFSENFDSHNQIIFNEAGIESMGLVDPVGKNIKIWGEERQIVGVVKDFHFESLYEKVGPCFLLLVPMMPGTPSKVMVKIQRGSERATIKSLDRFYHQHNAGLAFDYKFLDDDYQRLYASEQRVAVLSQYFAGIAILISCLGLFGLAAFTAERRLKEIGIRKVLGSSVSGIVYLLTSDFSKLVLVSILIAVPISYIIAKQWLDSFAYKIPLEWWYFTWAGLIALFIAWLTVGMQSIKAARINPTKCLRNE